MSVEDPLKSLCLVDLYKTANQGNHDALNALQTAWQDGGSRVSDRDGLCLTPCLLSRCGAELSLDFMPEDVDLRTDSLVSDVMSGTCARRKISLDGIALKVRARTWPEYGEYDIRPSDPDYMDY